MNISFKKFFSVSIDKQDAPAFLYSVAICFKSNFLQISPLLGENLLISAIRLKYL